MRDTTIKVFVADDHTTISDGLIAIVNATPGMSTMGKAVDGEQLLERIKHKSIDVLLLDINMPRLGGLEVLPILRERYPEIAIIMLSTHRNKAIIQRSDALGASGYLTKDAEQREIVAAIRAVAGGEKYYSQLVARIIVEGRENARKDGQLPGLTSRERRIICLITKELTSREIGERLKISHHTVERHRKNIFAKIGVKNVVGLVNFAHKHRLNEGPCEDS